MSVCDVGKSEDPKFLMLFPMVVFLSDNVKEPLNNGNHFGFTCTLKNRNVLGEWQGYNPDKIWEMLQMKGKIVYQMQIS